MYIMYDLTNEAYECTGSTVCFSVERIDILPEKTHYKEDDYNPCEDYKLIINNTHEVSLNSLLERQLVSEDVSAQMILNKTVDIIKEKIVKNENIYIQEIFINVAIQ